MRLSNKWLNIKFGEKIDKIEIKIRTLSGTLCKAVLTLSLLIATVVPYANRLDPDETPSNSASHSDQSCLTLCTYCYSKLTELLFLNEAGDHFAHALSFIAGKD